MNKKIITLGAIALFVTLSFVVVFLLKQDAQGQKTDRERVTKLPTIISKIDSLQLVTTKTENEGDPNAIAVLELKNNSNKSIIAVNIESGNEKDSAGISVNGIHDDDVPPDEIAKPFDTLLVSMPFANMRPGFPIRISGVIYADGSTEGEKATLDTMQRQIQQRKGRKQGGEDQ